MDLIHTLIYIFPIVLILLPILKAIRKKQLEEGKHKPIPEGPKGWPVVGFLKDFMDSVHFHEKLRKMGVAYGPICKVPLGSFNCVWLNSYDWIKSAWNQKSLAGRPNIPGVLQRTHHSQFMGITFNEGRSHQEQRSFTLRNLKDLGFSKRSMDSVILNESIKLVNEMEKSGGRPLVTHQLVCVTVLNILSSILTGLTYEFDDPELLNLYHALQRNLSLSHGAKAAMFIPWLVKYFPWLVNWKEYIKDSNYIFNFWRKYSDEKISNFHPKAEKICFMDNYIQEVHDCEDSDSTLFGDQGGKQLGVVLQDLFIAGTETTMITLCWLLLYAAKMGDQQEKLHEEIDKTKASYGEDNPRVFLENREKMVYTEAFILEVMRKAPVAPLGLFHRATEDTKLSEYFIPKGTIVMANVYAAHHDPKYWKDPEIFDPTRFISKEKETVLENREGFIPFSTGKRRCPGEVLARKELFISITTILNKFHVSCINPDEIQLDPIIGASAVPPPHMLAFENRTF